MGRSPRLDAVRRNSSAVVGHPEGRSTGVSCSWRRGSSDSDASAGVAVTFVFGAGRGGASRSPGVCSSVVWRLAGPVFTFSARSVLENPNKVRLHFLPL